MIIRTATVVGVALHVLLASAKQPSAPDAIPAPLRDLEIGDLNFLHTTDTHGWHGGHLQEPSYSADWGDYIDFSIRMREKIESQGKDLLLIDTGDRVEGNGLYDSDNPKGLHTLRIFKEQDIDIICAGNHELYQKNSSESEYFITVPAYEDHYLASNLNITDPRTGKSVPLSNRYRKFTTKKQGIRITAFGFMFNFTRNYNNTHITFVDNVVKEAWFQEVISQTDVDVFVVIGHAGVTSPEFVSIYKAIRAYHPYTPIQFFGGHEHRRAYKIFDLRSVALASGRFMETIGFQSIKGVTGPGRVQPIISFFRRYIDNNLYSYYHHTGLNEVTFHTARGRDVSRKIEQARKDLDLDKVYGCAPQDYWMNRVPFPSQGSIFTLLNETIFPEAILQTDRLNKHRLIMSNSGAIRFDIFKGPFTVDTTYIISPFTSSFHYIKDVPYGLALQLAPLLNRGGRQVLASNEEERGCHEYDLLAPPGQYSKYFNESSEDAVPQSERFVSNDPNRHDRHDSTQAVLGEASNIAIFPGYVTTDDAGNDGDDTIHTPIPQFIVPNVISSYVPAETAVDPLSSSSQRDQDDTSKIDLIFNAFLEPYILKLLTDLGLGYTPTPEEYLEDKSMTELIEMWIARNWKSNCVRNPTRI